MSKLNQARDILALVSSRFAQYAEHSQELAARRLRNEEWQEFLDIMCPVPSPMDPDYTKQRADRIQRTRVAIQTLYNKEKEQTLAWGTAWAAYNAVAEHIDHLPRRGATTRARAEARFNVALYGTGRDMKERAFQTACRFAGIDA